MILAIKKCRDRNRFGETDLSVRQHLSGHSLVLREQHGNDSFTLVDFRSSDYLKVSLFRVLCGPRQDRCPRPEDRGGHLPGQAARLPWPGRHRVWARKDRV